VHPLGLKADSFEAANIEIPRWFGQDELYYWEFGNDGWLISKN
jgi:hypothetical protein